MRELVACVDARREVGRVLKDSVAAQHVGQEVVREHGQAIDVVEVRHAGEREVVGSDLGTLVEAGVSGKGKARGEGLSRRPELERLPQPGSEVAQRVRVQVAKAVPRRKVQDVGDLVARHGSQLRRGPRRATRGEPRGQRVGVNVQLFEPTRAEVDRVQDQDVSDDLVARGVEAVQLGVQARGAAVVATGAGVDGHEPGLSRHTGAVGADLFGEHARRSVRAMRRILLPLAAALLSGCGGGSAVEDGLTLALDFTPNAVHAPLFVAADEGAFEIQEPGSGPDALKLVATGRAQLGVLDIHDLAIAQARGVDVVAVAALVDRPLAALVARPPVERPRDLENRTVGVSGLPSDPAFVRAIVAGDGGDPAKVDEVTIGFSAVTRILSGRVDAAPVFWNAEGVVLRERGLDVREFRVEDFGAPPYPEVVLITSRATLSERRDELRLALEAIDAGIGTVRAQPAAAAQRVADAAQAGDVGLVRAQLDAVLPLYGMRLDRDRLGAWAAFDVRIGLVDALPDIESAFDFELGKDLSSKAKA